MCSSPSAPTRFVLALTTPMARLSRVKVGQDTICEQVLRRSEIR